MSKQKSIIVLVILSVIAGLVYLTPFLRFSFYDQMKSALSLTDLQIGAIGASYGIFNVASYAPGGFLSEKFDTKKLLMLSCAGMFFCTVWYSFYPGYIALLIIHALYGIFSVGTFWSPYLKAIRSLASEQEQGKIFGVSEALRGLGQTIVAFICLGALGLFASNTVGFRVLLWINAAAFAVMFLAVLFLVPRFKEKEEASQREATDKKKSENIILRSLKNPSIWICIFVIMCGYSLWNTVNGYIGTYCTRILNIPENLSSTLSIIRSYIIVFVAGVTGGVLMDKFPSRGHGMAAFFSCTFLSVAGVVLSRNIIMLCVVMTVVLSYMVNAIKSTYWSILGDAGIPPESTGLATGIISLIGLTPDIFVSPVISRFITWGENHGNLESGFQLMWAWMAVWSLLGVLASWILKRKKAAASQM